MINLHISLTSFTHESRVLKETKTIVEKTSINYVEIAALHQDNLFEEEMIDVNRRVKRFKLSTRFLPKNLISQSFKYIEFLFRLVLFYRTKNIHIINIHTLALLPVGVILKYLFDCKLIYDTHELETETLYLKGFRKVLSKFVERHFIKFCESTICVNESISNWYFNEYKLNEVPLVLLNTPENNASKNKNDLFRKKFKINRHEKICLFQGNLNKGRGIEELVYTFKEYKPNGYCLVFLGNGQLSEWIKYEAKTSKNIFHHPAVKRDTLFEYTSSADIGLNFTDSKCLNHIFSLPNKFFEYSSAGLAILCSSNIEFKKFIDRYNCGICVSEINPKEINNCLNSLSEKQCKQFSENALQMFESNCWEKQERCLVTLYNNVLS